MLRILKEISLPLGKSAELKVRGYYKKLNDFSSNTSEQKIFDSLGINTRKTAYRVMTEIYNNYVQEFNNSLLATRAQKPKPSLTNEQRINKNTQARNRRANKNKKNIAVKVLQRFVRKNRYIIQPDSSNILYQHH